MSLSGLWPPSRPYTLHLHNSQSSPPSIGQITGLTFLTHPTKRTPSQPRAHYFGGVPYALPPQRFVRAEPLPLNHKYGTTSDPGVYIGEVGICPQPGDFGTVPEVREGEDGELAGEDWDEMCLACNIWVPVGEPPCGGIGSGGKGWPVLVFFHGGFLQFGSPNGSDYIGLTESPGKCIIVLPGYRVNVFGFLAGRELKEESGFAGNYGFWDQRLALEWTRDRIAYFSGDPNNMTIGGYSAGALSTFHQLSYDFTLQPTSRLHGIKRAILLANGTGIQPRTIADAQSQFNDLLLALDIPLSLSASEKLTRLRSVSSLSVVNASLKIPRHEFRHVTDDKFVKHDLFKNIDDGTWANHLKQRGIEILMGECKDEHFAFATWHSLSPNNETLDAVRKRLSVDYPETLINTLIDTVYLPASTTNLSKSHLPMTIRDHECTTYNDLFGHIYADIQVHGTQRGLAHSLSTHGVGHLFRRCIVGWRAKRADKNFPREMGATHGTDTALWFWGDGVGLELLKREEAVATEWCTPFWKWIAGTEGGWNESGWEGTGETSVRVIDGGGKIEPLEDEDWEQGCRIWEVTRGCKEVGVARWSLKRCFFHWMV